MSLRTKLLLYLTLLAVVPLVLFGLTANAAATSSLISVEHDNLSDAVGNVNRALTDIESTLARNVADNSNWDDIHAAVAKEAGSEDFFKTNFDPSVAAATPNTFGLQILGVWDSNNQAAFPLGRIEDFRTASGVSFDTLKDVPAPQSGVLKIGSDIYVVAYNAIRTSAGTDPNGYIVFGRKLGADDVSKIKELTGYDVALYQGQDKIAATQDMTATPAPAALQSAAEGQTVFDQKNTDIALAYSPLRDGKNNVIATFVIWRPRTATIAAQSSISSTLAIALVIGAILAILVAIILGRSITGPLLVVVN